jgi:hypothetical protein
MFNRECTGLKCARERKEWLKKGAARDIVKLCKPTEDGILAARCRRECVVN